MMFESPRSHATAGCTGARLRRVRRLRALGRCASLRRFAPTGTSRRFAFRVPPLARKIPAT